MTRRRTRRPGPAGAAFLFVCSLFLAACTTTTEAVQHQAYRKPVTPGTGILLMEPDIECSAVTAGGLVEPHAAWTAQCKRSVEIALQDFMAERKADLMVYDPADLPPGRVSRYRELTKLYEAVGVSMLQRRLFPTASAKSDWTMGKGVRTMREDHDADYALFVYLRDQYETGGRVATRVGLALLGVGTMPAVQVGFVSLVDLENGDIVWFNQLVSTTGDLRETAPARVAVDTLLEGSPVL